MAGDDNYNPLYYIAAMKRREFIIKTGKATALASLTGIVGFAFHNRDISKVESVYHRLNNFETAKNLNFPQLALTRNEDHVMALRSSLDAIGGIKRFINPGDKVTIKPNVAWDRKPEQAANTNPVLVGEMVRQCLSAGAKEVIVTDVTCNEARRTFLRSGIREATEKANGKIILPVEDDFVNANLDGEMLTVWPVLRHFIETDRFINMPVVKHHSLSACTVGMKNLYGIIGGQRNQLHQRIDQSIVDLANFIKPTLTVVDATRVLLRNGPQGGSLSDVALEHSVMCATDPVAADARASEFLALAPELVGHIALADSRGLGSLDYKSAGYKEIV